MVAKVAGLSKITQFYLLRAALAFATAACETHWLDAVGARLGSVVQRWTFFLLVLSPGVFISSSAFIPSSFAMACLLMCQSFHIRASSQMDTQHLSWLSNDGFLSVLAGACAVVVGWPFCIVALSTTGLDLLWRFGFLKCVSWGLIALALTVVPTVVADSCFYDKASDVTFSTWNLVAYNMFPRGMGSELYGVEPWHFYLRNLSLNFGPALPAALGAPLLLAALTMAHALTSSPSASRKADQGKVKPPPPDDSQEFGLCSPREACVSALLWTAPFFLWLAFMSALPHKEERFMFPVYPQLCLAAGVTLSVLQTALAPPPHPPSQEAASIPPSLSSSAMTSDTAKTPHTPSSPAAVFTGELLKVNPVGKGPRRVASACVTLALVCFATVFGLVSVGRTSALVGHYRAPLEVYAWLSDHLESETGMPTTRPGGKGTSRDGAATRELLHVCVGKEWYRFPSHFLLNPPHARLAFAEAGFRGQLPRFFDPELGTRGPPRDQTLEVFNEVNAEQRDRYVRDPGVDCDFVIDLANAAAAAPFAREAGSEVSSSSSSSSSSTFEPWHATSREGTGKNVCEAPEGVCPPRGKTTNGQWELLHTHPFLDASLTPALARIFLLPEWLSAVAPRVVPRPTHLAYEVWRNNKKNPPSHV